MCYMHFAINFRGNQSKDTSWLENVVKLETISISRLHLLVRSIFIPTKKRSVAICCFPSNVSFSFDQYLYQQKNGVGLFVVVCCFSSFVLFLHNVLRC